MAGYLGKDWDLGIGFEKGKTERLKEISDSLYETAIEIQEAEIEFLKRKEKAYLKHMDLLMKDFN